MQRNFDDFILASPIIKIFGVKFFLLYTSMVNKTEKLSYFNKILKLDVAIAGYQHSTKTMFF